MIEDIAAVMITVDRGERTNYLSQTLGNLMGREVNVFAPRLQIFDSKPGGFAQRIVDENGLGGHVDVHTPDEVLCANLNVAAALRKGSELSKWVLFLEDDIDVCGDFIGSTLRWLDGNATDGYRVYPLGANYEVILNLAHQDGKNSWTYPIVDFYGTQAFAIRSEDALSLAEYLEEDPYRITPGGVNWDLIMQSWSQRMYPNTMCFLTTVPSFVQHIGRSSTINPQEATHIFPSFPGPYWIYA